MEMLLTLDANEFSPVDAQELRSPKRRRFALRSLALGHNFLDVADGDQAELAIGRFYYKSKHYKAAMRRFKNVLTRYPDVGIHQEALKLIAKTEASLARSNQAGDSILPFF